MRIKRGCERKVEGLAMMTWCQSKAAIETGARLEPDTELKRWCRTDQW